MPEHRPFVRFVGIVVLVLLVWLGFAPSDRRPPAHLDQVCVLLEQHPEWYWAAKATQHKWGVPISTQMAFIYKESHFRAEAKPERETILGFIPWRHRSSAEGYAQAVNETWQRYLQATGRTHARRDDFAIATDFIGWYLHTIIQRTGISGNNVFALYLAYHEGVGGYIRKIYRHQPHLIAIAHRVQKRAQHYKQQLLSCESQLPRRHWWNISSI